MASSYLYPGVYIEEVSSGTRPIEAVGTSTAAFIGEAPITDKHVNELVWVNNWTEFARKYLLPEPAETGSASLSGETSSVDAVADEKGKAGAKSRAKKLTEESESAEPSGNALSHAVYGFFLNGGSRCGVVNVGAKGSLVGNGNVRKGLDLLEETDDVSIVAAPGRTDAKSYDQLLSHCEKMKDRIAILDAPATVSSVNELTKELRPRESDGGFGAFYFPHILVSDPLSPNAPPVEVAPSGHIAGICARTDATRGVHKAPANELIRGALGVSYNLTRDDQGVLNPNGVNGIRQFTGEGIRVYGARTVAASSSEWRYLNVRRLMNMIEESIARSTRWAVFEPNDQTLWKSLRRDVTAFLTSIWRQGALLGSSPEEAFFVKCDAETNPPEEIDQGRVFILIGVAPVKPAEFVIFRIGQSASGTDTE